MKKILMSSVLVASSLFVMTAGASVSSTNDTSLYNTSSYNNSSYNTMHKEYKSGAKGSFSQLNLTTTQESQIKTIMQDQYAAQKSQRGQYKAEREQMQQQIQALTDSKTLNTSALNRLADQQAAKNKQRFIDRVQTQHAISQVLTTEQRQKMAQLKSERKERSRKHWENRKATAK